MNITRGFQSSPFVGNQGFCRICCQKTTISQIRFPVRDNVNILHSHVRVDTRRGISVTVDSSIIKNVVGNSRIGKASKNCKS